MERKYSTSHWQEALRNQRKSDEIFQALQSMVCLSDSFETKIPLKSIIYEVKIHDSVATVNIYQTYVNNISVAPLDLQYYFSMSPNMCFDNLEIEVEEKIFKAEIIEKHEAKQIYSELLSKGSTVIYSEISDRHKDLLAVKLGNINPNVLIAIKLTYHEKLTVCLSKFWEFRINSVLTPRYGVEARRDSLGTEKSITLPYDFDSYPLHISVVIESSSDISFAESPSHKIIKSYAENNKKKVQIQLDRTGLNSEEKNDFALLYRNKAINIPYHLFTKTGNSKYPYCALISFFPEFNDANIDDAMSSYIRQQGVIQKNFDVQLARAKGEYIFFLDRSESMTGIRLFMAKSALQLFLKSLPQDSYFNIISFGDKFYSMFLGSEKSTEAKISEAVAEIIKYDADFGGTNILAPLEYVSKFLQNPGYPRHAFILTDGDVNNTSSVISFISKHRRDTTVHMIGLGKGCSKTLIIEGAEAGGGRHAFVTDGENLSEKVIDLLDSAISPVFSKFNLNIDHSIVEYIVPQLKYGDCLRKNESFDVFIFFNSKLPDQTVFSLDCSDADGNIKCYQLLLTKHTAIENQGLLKLGAFLLVKGMANKLYYEEDPGIDDDIFLAKKTDIGRLCCELSEENKILTPFTAFLCKISDSKNKPLYLVPSTVPDKEKAKGPFDDEIKFNTTLVSDENKLPCLDKMNFSSYQNPLSSKEIIETSVSSRIDNLDLDKLFSKSNIKPGSINSFDDICLTGFGEAPLNLPGINIKANSSNSVNESKKLLDLDSGKKRNATPAPGLIINKNKKFDCNPTSFTALPNTASGKCANKSDNHIECVLLQKADGSWENSGTVAKVLGFSLEDLESSAKFHKLMRSDYWVTILMIYFLQSNFKEQENSLKLIVRKAIAYLNKNRLDYYEYVNAAKGFLN